jgi:Phage integrase family
VLETTRNALGTPLGQRNVARNALASAVRRAGLDGDGRPPLRFHDLRHTFASHLIVDLRLDVCHVSRILGHARTAITLDVYTHLFERARPAADVRAALAGSRFAHILAQATATEPWLEKDAAIRGRIGWTRRTQRSVARPASVARIANVEVLDHSLTNLPCPGRAATPCGIAPFSSAFRWS